MKFNCSNYKQRTVLFCIKIAVTFVSVILQNKFVADVIHWREEKIILWKTLQAIQYHNLFTHLSINNLQWAWLTREFFDFFLKKKKIFSLSLDWKKIILYKFMLWNVHNLFKKKMIFFYGMSLSLNNKRKPKILFYLFERWFNQLQIDKSKSSEYD